jgi:biotin transport system substrate-specific component
LTVQTQSILWVSLFTALTAVGGFVRIPTPLVPITLQTFFVYLSGNLLGSRKGAASQLLFLAAGLIGIPVFGNGGGPGYVLQPTFGYLIGFPAAAWLIGKMRSKQRPQTVWKLVTATSAGCLLIHLTGVLYLYICMNMIIQSPLSWTHAIWAGVLIFLPGETLKIFLAVSIILRIHPHLHINIK